MSAMANLTKKMYCWVAHGLQTKSITVVLLNEDSMELPSK